MYQWIVLLCALGTSVLCAHRRLGRRVPRWKALAALLAANAAFGTL